MLEIFRRRSERHRVPHVTPTAASVAVADRVAEFYRRYARPLDVVAFDEMMLHVATARPDRSNPLSALGAHAPESSVAQQAQPFAGLPMDAPMNAPMLPPSVGGPEATTGGATW